MSVPPAATSFSLTGPLPTGTTVLEASAGTGKTYAIAALTTRFVVEGYGLEQLLLVTFGRNATDELRQRVRQRLVASERALARMNQADLYRPADDVEAWLVSADPELLALRRVRLQAALASFDAATIATTHEFCLRMLESLGVLGDYESDAVFVDRLSELTRTVASDAYLRRYASTAHPPFDYPEALRLAELSVSAVQMDLVPGPSEDDQTSTAAERVRFAQAVRAEVEHRKRSHRIFTYDDMLTRLHTTLADPMAGDAAVRRLQDRYRVVMVDEFQDTDPVQWDIVRRSFVGSSTSVILIGDPKQAIYGFRGADVYSYLDAVSAADAVHTLDINRRSDQPLIDALDSLLGGAALGDPRILVRPVRAEHQGRRLRVAADAGPPTRRESTADEVSMAPLRLRYLPFQDPLPLVDSNRRSVRQDLVVDVTRLLASRAELSVTGSARPVEPSDIAVLVRRNDHGEAIREALVQAGVPSVMLGATSVFAGAAATDWLAVLQALADPRQATIRRAALTSLVGWSLADLVRADDEAISQLTTRVRRWSRLLASRGMAAVAEAITTDTHLAERLLGEVGGERRLTDLRHIAQSCHSAMARQQLGPRSLLEWVQQQMEEGQSDTNGDGWRRLEVDAAAVTVVTVHRSKGLQFPIVYLPDPWDRWVNDRDEGHPLRLHDAATGRRQLDVGGTRGVGRSARYAQSLREEGDEDLRLFYVAATRAQCQLVVYWAPGRTTACSSLQRLLHRMRPEQAEAAHTTGGEQQGAIGAPGALVPDRREVVADPTSAPGALALALEPIPEEARAPIDWPGTSPVLPALAVRPFERELDLTWQRTSYSALTASTHSPRGVAGAASEPEGAKEDDEAALAATGPSAPGVGDDQPSPLADLPGGAGFGTAVHAVFEQVDAGTPDLPAELDRVCTAVLRQAEPMSFSASALADALLPSFLTPLGPLADHRRLCDFRRADRLPELTFEYPLHPGDATRGASGELRIADIAALLARHLPSADPLAEYPDRLAQAELTEQRLRGFLNGSIDAVLRLTPGRSALGEEPRYLVVDYKTNRLAATDIAALTLGDYRPERLATAMMTAHYPLQALLYQVALHRLLRWRQPGYQPAVHLGGVLYLFLRGMAGPLTPAIDGVPCGVFSWKPAAALVEELSDLLHRGHGGSA